MEVIMALTGHTLAQAGKAVLNLFWPFKCPFKTFPSV